MVAFARQLLAAGLHRGTERRGVLLLMAGAAHPPVGVRVGIVGQPVVAHALGELAHLLHGGRVGSLMLAAWGQVAALLLRGLELRVALLLVGGAAQLPVGIRVGEVGHAVVPDALRPRPGRLYVVGRGAAGLAVLFARRQQQRHQQQRRRQTSSQSVSCHERPFPWSVAVVRTSSPHRRLGRREGFPNAALTPDHGMMGRCGCWWWKTSGCLPTRSPRGCAGRRWPSTWPTTVMERWSGWRSTTTTSSSSTATCPSCPGTRCAARWSNPAPSPGS